MFAKSYQRQLLFFVLLLALTLIFLPSLGYAQTVTGSLQGTEVVCPMHGWGFDVRTGACTNRPDRPVQTYPTRIVDGQVEICI